MIRMVKTMRVPMKNRQKKKQQKEMQRKLKKGSIPYIYQDLVTEGSYDSMNPEYNYSTSP